MSAPTPLAVSLIGNLPRRPRVVDMRELGEIELIAVHCDGRDRLAGDTDLAVIAGEAQYHIDKNWAKPGQPVEHGDGLMYHFVVTSSGIYATRDLREVTWHANSANRKALAVMLLCGFNQAPTDAEIGNLGRLLDWLCHQRPDIPAGQGDVWGHGELTQYGNATPCPGGALKAWVQGYRTGGALNNDPYPIIHASTITPAVFAAQLKRRNSPALAEDPTGMTFFNTLKTAGIDPTIGLGFFGKESEFGSYQHSPVDKVAMQGARNWGNLRPNPDLSQPPGGRAKRRVESDAYGLFRGYESWQDGLRDWCEKMLSDAYRGKTLRQVLEIYAPISDGNDPAAYAKTLQTWAAEWAQASAPHG